MFHHLTPKSDEHLISPYFIYISAPNHTYNVKVNYENKGSDHKLKKLITVKQMHREQYGEYAYFNNRV